MYGYAPLHILDTVTIYYKLDYSGTLLIVPHYKAKLLCRQTRRTSDGRARRDAQATAGAP